MVGPGLVGRIEVSRFGRRLEGPDDDPGRVGAQMQGLAVQELGLRQCGSLGSFAVRSAMLGAARQFGCGSRSVGHSQCARTAVSPQDQEDTTAPNSAPLFSLGRSGCSPSEQLPGLGIDQRCLQVVFAQKPSERAHRPCWPLRAAIRPPRSKAGGNRCCRLDGLLIERFRLLTDLPKLLVPTGLKHPVGRGLKRHEPAQRLQAGLDVAWRVGSRGPFQSAPGEGAHCRRQARPRTRASLWFSLPRATTSICRPEARACGWRRGRPPTSAQ